MNFYGITIIASEGLSNGNESKTEVFPTQQEAIDYALSKIDNFFDNYDFEDEQDENGRTKEEIIGNLKNGVDAIIQASDEHVIFEFFQKDMGENIINRNDYLATITWSVDDITAHLAEKGYPFDEQAVRAVIDHGAADGSWKALEECLDSDWDIINKVIDEAVMLHPEIFNKEEEIEL